MKTAKKRIKRGFKKVVKPVVKLISYSIKMTIPTGQYANIQPEIVVKSGTMEEAHAYMAPHMNKLWKDYFMISERKVEVVKPSVTVIKPVENVNMTNGGTKVEYVTPEKTDSSPVSDVALVKATQAIQSCMSPDALNLIIKQIGVSTKLTEENKKSLLPLIERKSLELNEKK